MTVLFILAALIGPGVVISAGFLAVDLWDLIHD